MKKVTITAVMLVIAMFMLTTNVQAYSMSFSGTKTTVESGETFNVTVSVDEATTRANGHIKYDSSLFTFVSSTGSNMTANATSGTVQWLYSEPVGQETGTKSFTFTFKAADVTETKKGTFTMEDFIAITKDNEEGYGQDKNTIGGTSSVEVTINKKSTEPTWKIDPSEDFTLEKGESKQLTADEDVTWSTSDSSVATVDKNGKVTGVGEGSATITATDKDGNKQTVTVTVTDNSQTSGDDDKHDNWSIEPSEDFSLKVGDKKKLTADGEGITWKSSNEKVAKVDQNGNVTAVGAGTATITAIDKYGNTKTIKVTVTVTKKTTTAGKKDNTQSPDSKLPQTGENAGKFAVLGIAGIVLAAGIVFKKKAKELDKLFVLLPIVAVLSLSGTVNAVKVADSEKLTTGIFSNLIKGIEVLAISPNKEFETADRITLPTIKSLVESETIKVKTITKNKKELKEEDAIPTGAIVTVGPTAGEGESAIAVVWDYTVLLYGDANGDGKICDASDIDVIRQDYVFNKKAEGEYKLAADLVVDKKLDVRDIQRMINKYLGKLDDETLVKPFPDGKMDEGETIDESLGVAQVKSTGKLYISVQYAVNATKDKDDTVLLLKDTKETITIPETKNLTLDLNGHSLTGPAETFYTIATEGTLSIVNSGEKEATIDRPATTDIHNEERGTVTGADIWVKKSGNVSVGENVKLLIQIAGGSNIQNTGSGDVTVDGAVLTMNDAYGANAIRDNGENSDIFIYRGDFETNSGQDKTAIRKGSNGNIYIGKDSVEHEDVDGIQKDILYKTSENEQLYINGYVNAMKAQIYYYNGEINGGLTYKNNKQQEQEFNEPILRDGARLVKTVGDVGIHYEELAEGELPISYSLYFSKNQVIEGVDDAVCYLTDDSKFGTIQNFFRYFKTVQDAIDAEPNGTHENFNGVSPNEGGKLNIISLMKKGEDENKEATVTESIDIPKDKKVFLFGDRLDTQTLIGEADKNYTIKAEGDLVVKNMTILRENMTSNSENTDNDDEYLVNVLMEESGSLELQEKAVLKLRDADNSENIRNEGSGDIIIDGAEISSAITQTRPGFAGINTIGIHDMSSESDIYVKEGKISGTTAICKENDGKIEIGELSDVSVLGESQLYIHGSIYCLDVCSSAEVYFYNGKLKTDLSDKFVCCERTNTDNSEGDAKQHEIKEGNSKFDIVVENRSCTSAYYIADNSQNGNPMVWDVATGKQVKTEELQSASSEALVNVVNALALNAIKQ